jgi:hypothetical protein
VLERALRIAAIVLSAIVALGFVLFALEDVDRASANKVSQLDSYQVADPTPAGETERERRHSRAREWVDDANDVLLKPFAGVSEDASSRWVQRGVPTLLGLLVYGFGLGYLARYAQGRG